MYTFLAFLPFIVAISLMLLFRFSSRKALGIGWLVIVLSAIGFWELSPRSLGALHLVSLGDTLNIILIIFGALLLLNHLSHIGVMNRIRESIQSISPDPRVQMLIIGFVFVALIEGAAGFGTSAALAAPILVSLGFPALAAAIITLLFSSIPVTFGSVGIPLIGGLQAIPEINQSLLIEISSKAAFIHTLAGSFVPFFALYILITQYGKNPSRRHFLDMIPFTTLALIVFFIPYNIIAQILGPELPSLIAGLIAIPLLMTAARRTFLTPPQDFYLANQDMSQSSPCQSSLPIWKAWFPYILVAILLVLSRLPYLGLGNWLSRYGTLTWNNIAELPDVTAELPILFNPGIFPFLFITAGIFLINIRSFRQEYHLLSQTLGKVKHAFLPLFFGLSMVQIMLFTNLDSELDNMVTFMAESLANLFGTLYPFVAPLFAIIGTFVSGSSTVSNILFAPLQYQTAEMLNLSTMNILTTQVVVSALAAMISLTNIVIVSTTLGLTDSEADILRTNIGAVIIYSVLAVLSIALFL